MQIALKLEPATSRLKSEKNCQLWHIAALQKAWFFRENFLKSPERFAKNMADDPVQNSAQGGGFVIPSEAKEKFPELVAMIKVSQTMDLEEKNYWFSVLPIMTEDQIDELRDILESEKKKEEEKTKATQKVEQRIEKKQARIKTEREEQRKVESQAEALLASLDDFWKNHFVKIVSWNVNGLRAVERKGELQSLLANFPADIFLFQEIKAQGEALRQFETLHDNFLQFSNCAEKKGYSGTAIWVAKDFAKKNPVQFFSGIARFEENEGRICRVEFGNFQIFSVYFPNGGKSKEAWLGKLEFYERFLSFVESERKKGKKIIFAGDVNCAHSAIDLARPQQNDGKIGFHPLEREKISKFVDQGWVDVFRSKFPAKQEFTWWDLKTRARDRNVGWRLDYFFCDGEMLSQVQHIEHLQDQMGSDHCPVLLQIGIWQAGQVHWKCAAFCQSMEKFQDFRMTAPQLAKDPFAVGVAESVVDFLARKGKEVPPEIARICTLAKQFSNRAQSILPESTAERVWLQLPAAKNFGKIHFVDIFKKLNPAQRAAVEKIHGPMLVVAGAGSGKTLTLTCRVANMIQSGIRPESILAVTFTNKAAKEMQSRVSGILSGQDFSRPWIGTFHSIGARLLRWEIEVLGREKSFTISDAEDSLALVRQICKDLNMSKEKFAPRAILSRISFAKNQMVTPDQLAQMAENFFDRQVAQVFENYEKQLLKMNACDFDDLICLPVQIFRQHENVLRKFQQRWQFLLIDEFQDTNNTQAEFVKLLGQKHQNVCAIGDGDQSIYSFRGANVSNIFDFEKSFPNCEIVKLQQNYRSTENILQAANAVIANNSKRSEKEMFSENGSGEMIKVFECENERAEAERICQEILKLKSEEDFAFSDFVVLYRTNAQSRVLEENALRFSIPYQIIGGVKFYARREIKDTLAFLRFLQNELDAVSFMRIVNVPPRKIGKTSLARLGNFAASRGLEISQTLPHIAMAEGLTSAAKLALENFGRKVAALRQAKGQMPVSSLIEKICETFALEKYFRDGTEMGEMRWENVRELCSVAQKFDGVDNSLDLFLEEVALITDADQDEENADRITLMTLHNAKGLEFPVVFIAGCEENILPHSRSTFSLEDVEEERRLFYVGITRAMQRLHLLFARERMVFGNFSRNRSSRFLEEIPSRLCQSNARNFQENEEVSLEPIFDDFPEFVAEFFENEKVEHPTFGIGQIVKVEGDILTVRFANGEKRLAASIAPLRKVEESWPDFPR